MLGDDGNLSNAVYLAGVVGAMIGAGAAAWKIVTGWAEGRGLTEGRESGQISEDIGRLRQDLTDQIKSVDLKIQEMATQFDRRFDQLTRRVDDLYYRRGTS